MSSSLSPKVAAIAREIRSDSLEWKETDPYLLKLQRRKPEEYATKLSKLEDAYRTILETIGEDPTREGLVKTPHRAAKAMLSLNRGYTELPHDILNGAVFSVESDDMVIIRDIDLFSLCEHHLVPFHGKVHIGYIPKGKVLGLSKVARVAEMYSRRLQIQERLTREICTAIEDMIQPAGVGVIIEATHMCMTMRGASKPGSWTTTSCMRGAFREDQKTREEFLNLVHAPKTY